LNTIVTTPIAYCAAVASSDAANRNPPSPVTDTTLFAVEKQGGTVKVLRKEKPETEEKTKAKAAKTAGKEAGGEASA
jgi:hypothetical protein